MWKVRWKRKFFLDFGCGLKEGDGRGFGDVGRERVERLGLRSGLFMAKDDFWITRYYLRVDLWKIEGDIRGIDSWPDFRFKFFIFVIMDLLINVNF